MDKQKAGRRSVKEWGLRVGVLLAGLIIAHLGVTLFLLADLGSDPFNVLIQGIFRSLQKVTDFALLTHGNVHIAISFIIIISLLFVDRSYIKIGTVLCMVFGGPIIDAYTLLLNPLFEALPSLAFKIAMNAAGCVILAGGMTLVRKSDAGTGPNDLVAVVISDKSRSKFSIIRMIVDFSFVLAGFLLGGSIGAGTIICAFLVGPVAGFFLPRSGRLVASLTARL